MSVQLETFPGGTDPKFGRQWTLVRPDQLEALGPITVIGAGGIGSWVILALAKLGVKTILAVDPDQVEVHNQPNQLYGSADIGANKGEALARICYELAETQVDAIVDKVGKTTKLRSAVVISGVDSMSARSAIWEAVKASHLARYYIDARMGAKMLRILGMNLGSETREEEIKRYEATLYSDDEAEVAPCTERAIVYTPLVTAALIADDVTRLALGQQLPADEEFDFTTRTFLSQVPDVNA